MEIDFLVQDTFALTRPQWQLAQTLEEAGSAFADAVAQNYKSDEAERVVEADEAEEFSSSGGDGDEIPVSNVEEAASSSEEIDTEVSSGDQGRRHVPADTRRHLLRAERLATRTLTTTLWLHDKRRSATQRPKQHLIGSWHVL